jgi:hypothetical protein
MPDGRFLSKSIAYSAQVGSVSLEADYLFMRMIPHLDSSGRMIGTPSSVKALCCPLRHEMTVEIVEQCLTDLQNAGLIVWYEAKGERCIAFPRFTTHQRGARLEREGASRLPAPPTRKPGELRRTPENGGVTPPNSGKGRVSKEKLSEVKSSEVKNAGAKAPRVVKGVESWLDPIRVVWEKHKGEGTFRYPKAAGLLAPLHKAGHSVEDISERLNRYLPDAGRFASLARFAETYGDHGPVKLAVPPVQDGWMSSEIERLTRPA